MHTHSLLQPFLTLMPLLLELYHSIIKSSFSPAPASMEEKINTELKRQAKSTATVNRQSLITAGRGRTVQAESGRGVTICQLPLSNWRMAGLIAMEAICVYVCVCACTFLLTEYVWVCVNESGQKCLSVEKVSKASWADESSSAPLWAPPNLPT